MKRPVLSIFGFVASVLLWACSGDTSSSTSAVSEQASEPSSGLSRASGPIEPIVLSILEMNEDVWMVGGERGERGGHLLRIRQGRLQSVSDVPVGPTLWWVWQGISETIHATGEDGRVLSQQERGDQWVVERPIEDARVTFWGGWTSPEGRLWVVGGSRDLHGPKGVVFSRTPGHTWLRHDVASLGVDGNLYKVWGVSDREVYIVGENGVILRWDGESMTREVSPTDDLLFTVHGNSNGVMMAVGGASQGRILSRQGDRWIAEELPDGMPPLSGIFVRDDGQVAAVGERGAILTRSAERHWSRRRDVVLRELSALTLHGVSFSNRLWAVGGIFIRPQWRCTRGWASDTRRRRRGADGRYRLVGRYWSARRWN